MSVGMDRGCFFFNQPESNHHMPFLLPFLGISFASYTLISYGKLIATVNVLSSVIGLLLVVIAGLIAVLALRYVKKQ